ncbi:fimbrial biogenesis chaperone [Klebsiella quasipneumoniae]|nr:molecular chaperone [Klebsiella quasipneumoniae]
MKTQVAVLLSALAFQACAGITINASRVIYSGKDKVASLNINNRSSTPYKVQIWLDAGLNRSRVGLPMVATPPLVYLSPQQTAQLRFIYLGGGLPADRESLYWVNIQENPPPSDGNHTLQFIVRTRLKLFYRPPAIATTLAREVRKLQWQQSGNNLRLTNSGPLHITLVNGALIDNKGHISPMRNVMLRPYSSYTVSTTDSARLYKLNYIDDDGAVVAIPLQAAYAPAPR